MRILVFSAHLRKCSSLVCRQRNEWRGFFNDFDQGEPWQNEEEANAERERERERERAAEINLHTVARDSAASEPIHAGIVIKLRFSVTGAPAVTKLQVMPRVPQRRSARPSGRSRWANGWYLKCVEFGKRSKFELRCRVSTHAWFSKNKTGASCLRVNEPDN